MGETVSDFLGWWMEHVVPLRVRSTTAAHYDNIVRRRLQPAFGHLLLRELDAVSIQTHLATELRTGRAATSVRQTLRVLRVALESAVTLGLASTNVARQVATPRVPRGDIVPLGPREVRPLLRAAAGGPAHAAIVLALCGLRAGEVRGLSWQDIDLVRRLVHVRRSAQWAGRGLELLPPKTPASVRTINLPQFAVEVLRTFPKSTRRGFVYAGTRGLPLHGSVHGRWLAAASRRAGVNGVTMHRLRHTAAAMLLESGVHLRIVMTVLGHARVQTTLDLYGHLRPELHPDAAEAMDGWMRRRR